VAEHLWWFTEAGLTLKVELGDILRREIPPRPWSEGEKIPWNEPGFSRRMLKEHLSQDHDAASRRFELIDQHVHWIHQHVLAGKVTKILDLGCGPGFYTQRFAKLGHECVGIDFSPAAVAYAVKQAAQQGLSCRYDLADIRVVDYGLDYGLVMLIFGEYNVFKPQDACTILAKVFRALRPGGILLLEPHTFTSVQEIGSGAPTWYSSPSGLFSGHPHLYLQENFWDTGYC
jgi:SAM-dependent methyltransferase